MSRLLALSFAFLFFIPVLAAPVGHPEAPSQEGALRWIFKYRENPDPDKVPAVIKALSRSGAFREPETAGVYVGFFAGVLSANPREARSILTKTLPLPFEDQWFLIKSVAYSGLPDWRAILTELSQKMPQRRVMAERYASGALPILAEAKLEPQQPGTFDKVKGFVAGEGWITKKPEPKKEITFLSNPDLIDGLWGLYFATGRDEPLIRILRLLPWSAEKDSVEKLTVGSMAKYTLASNASRDANLLTSLKRLAPGQPKEVAKPLAEAIEAAETVDTARIRKDALAAVEEMKTKGGGTARNIAWWGSLGETAISLGCLGAAVSGQVEFGVPCVVGGALSTAALKYLARPE